MQLCRLLDPITGPTYALYRDAMICPVAGLADKVADGDEKLALNSRWWEQLNEPEADAWLPAPTRLLPPVPNPEKIICIGLNYLDHAIETGAEPPTEPVVFSKFNTALVGHGDTIELPPNSNQVDYEAELVVVIGRDTKNVSVDAAMDHVLGYCCGHDVSARDWQKGRPGGQWLLGKTFDTFAPLGPALVLKDEVADPGNLGVRMHLNGQTVQDSTTAQLIFDIPTLISHLSSIFTLRAGDLIYTGTPPGVGAARQPPLFLKPGDVCEVEIESVGKLSNPCR
ncbi:MAG: fumarylacetoacetate hydrolase family protein [Planctomycetota bacterium]